MVIARVSVRLFKKILLTILHRVGLRLFVPNVQSVLTFFLVFVFLRQQKSLMPSPIAKLAVHIVKHKCRKNPNGKIK